MHFLERRIASHIDFKIVGGFVDQHDFALTVAGTATEKRVLHDLQGDSRAVDGDQIRRARPLPVDA